MQQMNSKLSDAFNDAFASLAKLTECSKASCKMYQSKQKEVNKKYVTLRNQVKFTTLDKWQNKMETLNKEQDKELLELYTCVTINCNQAIQNIIHSRIRVNEVMIETKMEDIKTANASQKKFSQQSIERLKKDIARDKGLLTKNIFDASNYRSVLSGQ